MPQRVRSCFTYRHLICMYLLDSISLDWQTANGPVAARTRITSAMPFCNSAWQRVFLEYWYRSCWAFRGARSLVGEETLNAHTWVDARPNVAGSRFHFFFIFYSRWTNPFLHSICIRICWLFPWDNAFPKVRHVGRVIWQSLFAFIQPSFTLSSFPPSFFFVF